MNRGVDRADGFARRVFAVLTHHRLVHHFGILRPLAVVLVKGLRARVVAIDPDPVHDAAMGDLQFADNRDVVFRLAGDDAGAASGAGVEIDCHAPLLGRGEWRVRVERRQLLRQFFVPRDLLHEVFVVRDNARGSLP